jgi:flagellar basal-body rod protein FlgF
MIRGMYCAASALDTAATNHELVAENLANCTAPGYRRQGLLFAAYSPLGEIESMAPGDSLQDVRAQGTFTQFETGSLQHTGNPLDLALSGNAFFVLAGPNGSLYTRNGVFEMNGQGELQSKGGLRLQGQGGPITIPSTATTITVNSEGTVYANGLEVGRLQLAQFTDPRVLRRAGGSLFAGPESQPPPQGTVRVEQGFREGSNVQIVNEMVSMMLGMRYYEAAQRALTSLSDAVAQNTRPSAS